MSPENEVKVVAGIAHIQATLEAQNKILAAHTTQLAAVNYTLNGNGKPGLKQEVAAHTKTLSTMSKVFWIVATPVLAAAGGGVVTLIVWAIQHIPKS